LLFSTNLYGRRVQFVAPPWDPLSAYQQTKQVELNEFILKPVTPTRIHMGTLAYKPETVSGTSNPDFELNELFRYWEQPIKPSIPVVYLVQVYVLDLHLHFEELDSVSFQLPSVHELVAL
jgi:hypothetical protein